MPNSPSNMPQNARTGSGFTNLQQYLGANEGNNLNDVITGGVNQQLGGVNTTLQGAQGDFASQLANASQLGSSTDIQNEQDILNKLNNSPTDINQNDINAFQNYRTTNYNGPKQLSDTSEFPKLTGQVDYLNSLGKNLQNPGGKSQLLSTFINRPDYTQGEQNFDATLLGNSPNNASFNQLGQQIQNTSKAVAGAEAQAGAQAQNTADQTQQFKQGVYNTLGLDQTGNYTGANQNGLIEQNANTLNQRVNDYTQQQNAAYQQSLQDLQNQNVTNNPYLASLSGMTTYGVAPSSALLTKAIAPNASNVASANDAARINALTQLAGINNTFITDPSQVGTYNHSAPVSFDTNAYKSQVQTAKNAYDSYLNNLVAGSGINNFSALTGNLTNSQIQAMTPQQAQAFLQQYGNQFNVGKVDQNGTGVYQQGGNFQGTLPQIIAQANADLANYSGMSGNALSGNNNVQADLNQKQNAQQFLNIINNAYGANQVIKGNTAAPLVATDQNGNRVSVNK